MTTLIVLFVSFLILLTIAFVVVIVRYHRKSLRLINEITLNLRLALDSSNASVWQYDVATRQFCALHGDITVPDGTTYEECYEALHEESREIYTDVFRKMLAGESKRESAMFHFVAPDGTDLYHDSKMGVVCNPQGNVVRIVGTQRDITEEYRKRQEFNLNHRLLHLIFENSPVGIAFIDTKGEVIKINNTYLRMYETEQPMVKHGAIRSFFDDPNIPDEIKERLQNGETIDCVIPYDLDAIVKCSGENPTAGSRKRIIELIGTATKTAEGEITGYLLICSDVTENAQLNREYETLFRQQEAILEMLPVGVELYNSDGWLSYQNKESRAIFGGTDLTYQVNLFDNPNLTDEEKESIRQGGSIKRQREYSFDAVADQRYYETDRRGVIYINTYLIPVTDRAGTVVCYSAVMQDMTEQVRAQKQMEMINRKLNMVINSSEIAPWDYDVPADEFSTYAGGETEVKLSSSKTFYPVIIYSGDRGIDVSIRTLMREGRDESFSFDIRYKITEEEPEWRYGTIVGTPFEYNNEGKVLKYTGYKKDITQWRNLTAELENINKQNKLVLNNTQSGFLYFTPDFKVQWENVSRIYKDFTLALKYRQGMICYKEVKGIDSPCELCPLTKAMKTSEPCRREVQIEDGNYIELLATPIFDKQNELEGVVVRVDHITERKRINLELNEAKEKAEQSNQLKSAFLANMSHEIRTPLNAIVGFSDIVMEAEDEQEREEYRKIISSNSDLLLNLINDILDLSKIESGYWEMRPGRMDITELINEVRGMFMLRVKEEVEMILSIPYQHCFTSDLDKQRVMQILVNFVSNAVKFTTQGSIRIGYEYLSGGIKLFVEDTGIGISEEDKGKVFQRFQKFDSFAQGTGLGLSICKALVDAMNGQIGFKSEFGRGSAFWAWIPCEVSIEEFSSGNPPKIGV